MTRLFGILKSLATPAGLALLLFLSANSQADAQGYSTGVSGYAAAVALPPGPEITVTTTTPTPPPPPPVPTVPETPPVPTTPEIPTPVIPVVPTDVSRRIDSPVYTIRQEEVPSGFTFAMAKCQGVLINKKKAAIYPVRGSLYALEQDGDKTIVDMARGRMLVLASEGPIQIKAGASSLSLKKGAAAVVESSPGASTKLFCVAGRSATEVSFSQDIGLKPVSLEPGELVVVADSQLEEEELIPMDGVGMGMVAGRIESRPHPSVGIGGYSLNRMLKLNLLIACRPVKARPSDRASAMLKTMHSDLARNNSLEDDEPETMVAKGADDFVPVAHTPYHAALQSETVVTDKDALVIASRQSVYKQINDREIELELGSLLVKANKSITVAADGRRVEISAGAVAIVQTNGVSLKVTNLSDLKKDTVAVSDGKDSYKLKCSEEVVFTDKAPALADIFDVHTIGHKGIEVRKAGAKGWITSSDVHLLDALKKHPLLSALRGNHAHKLGAKLINQVAKTAAVLSIMGKTDGKYHTGQPNDEAGIVTVATGACQSCSGEVASL